MIDLYRIGRDIELIEDIMGNWEEDDGEKRLHEWSNYSEDYKQYKSYKAYNIEELKLEKQSLTEEKLLLLKPTSNSVAGKIYQIYYNMF